MSDEQQKPPTSTDKQPQTPPTAAPEPVVDTSTATPEPIVSEPVVDTPIATPEPVVREPARVQEPQPTKLRLLDRLLPSFRSVEAFWDATLIKIRSLLPQSLSEKLSDWGLTGAIAGILVAILLITASLLPETPTQLAKAPPNSIDAPPELKAPQPPQPVEVEIPPAPELTPEQSLVGAIQSQVANITEQYGSGLIQSVEANFLKSRLVVKVSNSWYNLAESEQNKLADEMLGRSKELDFSKLEILGLDGTILARSPVVGSNMVILKRQELATEL